ncbi:hypothetical protein AB3Y40_16965 [Yoonia sp. R2331]|uniref:hypothetical protein n=1 Tax=Yoonia sp. R2331 TaxID=3237238 RepID=UPI0034E3DB2F
MSDLAIAKSVFRVGALRNRSVIINRPDTSPVEDARLKKFGSLYPIGVDGLVEQIDKLRSEGDLSFSAVSPKYLGHESTNISLAETARADVEKLLLTGKFDPDLYVRQLQNPDEEQKYCVDRSEKAERIINAVSTGRNRFLVTSDLGNGKSIFLRQLSCRFAVDGYDVYRVESTVEGIFGEIDLSMSRPGRKCFIVDDFVRHRRVAEYIGSKLTGESVLILSATNSDDEFVMKSVPDSVGGSVSTVSLDQLSVEELVRWDSFLESWGFWEEALKTTAEDRMDHLKQRCAAENRSILVSMFSNSSLANRIDQIVNFFLGQNPGHRQAFIAILINGLCSQHVQWSRIVAWLNLDEFDLEQKIRSSGVLSFMGRGAEGWYNFSSNSLSDFILNKYEFETSEIVDVYSEIVRQTAYSSTDRSLGWDAKQNLKELMRFGYLSTLLRDRDDAKLAISSVYSRLGAVGPIRKSDQFWLQYAMSEIELDNLDRADGFIANALAIAERKGVDYLKHQIKDQRARLRLKMAAKLDRPYRPSDVKEAIQDLIDNLSLRESLAIYSMRSVPLLEEFLEARLDELTREEVAHLKNFLTKLGSSIEGRDRLEKSRRGEVAVLKGNILRCNVLIASI